LSRKVPKQNGGREAGASASNFIRSIIASDVEAGRTRIVVTRFPPEPNGYLHLGHAKSIVLNYELAKEFGGRCNLRFDDTNPAKERAEYIDAIKRDVQWLGFDWAQGLHFASDYFEQLYAWACHLVRIGKAYVDDQSAHDIREGRGTLTSPGRNSPFRDRTLEENAQLFARMRAGEFRNGERVLRAKIDMASANLNLRDPVIYRILDASHPRTGAAWHIYPSYDFAHGQCDAIEEVSHSLCTLEFEDHRPLYDWFLDNLRVPSRPRQYEFARLGITHTILSKRALTQLVRDGHVAGWDDPRMPTLGGLRRRGVPPEAVRRFIRGVGVSKAKSTVDDGVLDAAIRDVLNERAPRRMAVLKPLKVIIENYPAGRIEEFDAPNHPADPAFGRRAVRFSREVYIEQDDFQEAPPDGFRRLAPGREVRLRYAYLVSCRGVVKDATGRVVELRCTYDPDGRGGAGASGRKVGAIHWVSACDALPAEVRLYGRLFSAASPGLRDLAADLDPHSMQTLSGCLVERATASDPHGQALQFERQGYFTHDDDSHPERLVFNLTALLRESPGKPPTAHLDLLRK
jgi:glutaminyl-tRNA synthetase